MRTHLIAKANRINIIMMCRNPQDRALSFQIIDIDTVIRSPSNNLIARATKAQRPDTEMPMTPPPPASSTPSSSHIREIQNPRVRIIHRIRRRETNLRPNRTIRQMPVLRAQSSIRNSPLTMIIPHGLVIFPVIRVTSIVHPNLEVLATGEEEGAVFAELA